MFFQRVPADAGEFHHVADGFPAMFTGVFDNLHRQFGSARISGVMVCVFVLSMLKPSSEYTPIYTCLQKKRSLDNYMYHPPPMAIFRPSIVFSHANLEH